MPTSSPEGAEALAAVFVRAMAPEASDRYPSATAFVEALADVADVVTPRTKASRRKAVVAAPLLEFEQADDPPALTMGLSDEAPGSLADFGTVSDDRDAVALAEGPHAGDHDHDHDHDLPS